MFPTHAGEIEKDPMTVFKATTDPDTMYLHYAMKQRYAEIVRDALQKECDDQIGNRSC